MPGLFDTRYGWILRAGRVDYELALMWQHALVKMRREGLARDTIILIEHPPVITVGRADHEKNFSSCRLKPIRVERGGDVTYHGPGQLVVYFIFDLARRARDLRKFLSLAQQGVVEVLGSLGLIASVREGKHRGVWVNERKIASVGIAVKNWITYHGLAVNLNTDLAEFAQINPCGLNAETMTSARELLGHEVNMEQFARELCEHYARLFVTVFEPVELESLAEELESQAGGFTI